MEYSKKRRANNYNDNAQKQAVLPPEMICEILARLPVESILVCRSVCKSWRDMTRNSYFINLQLNKTRDEQFHLVLQSRHTADLNSLFLLNFEACKVREIRLEKIQLRTRFRLELPALQIRCSCDGLLCMALERMLDPVIICNPITRESVILPLSISGDYVASHQLGFGFDQASGRYKVVREYRTFANQNVSKFQVITLGESSWRSLSPPQNLNVFPLDAAVFWNGSLHWIINEKTVDERVLAFDLADEKFYTIPFPGMHNFGKHYELLVLGKSLALVEHDEHMMKLWKVLGNKVEGFSVHCTEYDTCVLWNANFWYTTIWQPNCDCFLLHVWYKDQQNARQDWFQRFVPDKAQYLYQNIDGLPNNFNAFHFRPSFVSPTAAPPGAKSSCKEQLNLVSGVWNNWVGSVCGAKPSVGTLTSLFFSKWRWV